MNRRPCVFMRNVFTKPTYQEYCTVYINICFCFSSRKKIPLPYHCTLIRYTMHRRNKIKGPWIYEFWIMYEWIGRSCVCVCVCTCLFGVFNTWNHSIRKDVAGCWLGAGQFIHSGPNHLEKVSPLNNPCERMGEWANKCAYLSKSGPLNVEMMKWCWVYSFFSISSPMLTQLRLLYKQTIINPQPSAYKNPSWNILNHWIRMGISGQYNATTAFYHTQKSIRN